MAVMLCVPTVRALSGKIATPALLTVAGGDWLVPSTTNVTEPVGTPVPGAIALMLADNVSVCP